MQKNNNAERDRLKDSIPESAPKNTNHPSPAVLTGYRLAIVALAVLSIVAALLLVRLPEQYQFAMVAIVPALLVGAYVFINPYAGVWVFVLMDYLRPYTFIGALRPLRLGILTVAATLASWIVHQAVKKEHIRWHSISTWFLAYLLIITSSIFTALNMYRAYMILEAMIVVFIMYFLIVNIVKSLDLLYRIIWLMLLIHLYYALKGIYNFAIVGYVSAGEVTSGVVGGSFMADENDFAMALNAMIPFAFFMFQNQSNKFKKLLLLAILLIFSLGVVSSQSRGGWVGLMAVTIFCIFKSKQKIISLTVIGVLCTAVVVFAPSSYWMQVSSITNTEESTARSRLNYWKAGYRMFLDFPITGIGAGNGPIHMPDYVTGFKDPATQWGRTFHGTLPLVIAETGALGILCYLAMFFTATRTLMKVQKRFRFVHKSREWVLASSLMGAIVGWMASATFLSAAYYPHLWTMYAMTATLSLIIGPESHGTTEGSLPKAEA